MVWGGGGGGGGGGVGGGGGGGGGGGEGGEGGGGGGGGVSPIGIIAKEAVGGEVVGEVGGEVGRGGEGEGEREGEIVEVEEEEEETARLAAETAATEAIQREATEAIQREAEATRQQEAAEAGAGEVEREKEKEEEEKWNKFFDDSVKDLLAVREKKEAAAKSQREAEATRQQEAEATRQQEAEATRQQKAAEKARRVEAAAKLQQKTKRLEATGKRVVSRGLKKRLTVKAQHEAEAAAEQEERNREATRQQKAAIAHREAETRVAAQQEEIRQRVVAQWAKAEVAENANLVAKAQRATRIALQEAEEAMKIAIKARSMANKTELLVDNAVKRASNFNVEVLQKTKNLVIMADQQATNAMESANSAIKHAKKAKETADLEKVKEAVQNAKKNAEDSIKWAEKARNNSVNATIAVKKIMEEAEEEQSKKDNQIIIKQAQTQFEEQQRRQRQQRQQRQQQQPQQQKQQLPQQQQQQQQPQQQQQQPPQKQQQPPQPQLPQPQLPQQAQQAQQKKTDMKNLLVTYLEKHNSKNFYYFYLYLNKLNKGKELINGYTIKDEELYYHLLDEFNKINTETYFESIAKVLTFSGNPEPHFNTREQQNTAYFNALTNQDAAENDDIILVNKLLVNKLPDNFPLWLKNDIDKLNEMAYNAEKNHKNNPYPSRGPPRIQSFPNDRVILPPRYIPQQIKQTSVLLEPPIFSSTTATTSTTTTASTPAANAQPECKAKINSKKCKDNDGNFKQRFYNDAKQKTNTNYPIDYSVYCSKACSSKKYQRNKCVPTEQACKITNNIAEGMKVQAINAANEKYKLVENHPIFNSGDYVMSVKSNIND